MEPFEPFSIYSSVQTMYSPTSVDQYILLKYFNTGGYKDDLTNHYKFMAHLLDVYKICNLADWTTVISNQLK